MSDRTVLASNDEQKIAIMLHLYSFCEQIQDHLTTITDMHPKLNEKGVPFRGQGNIRPIQCNVAVNTLEEVITRLQSFCHIFRTDVYSLPLAFIILRYRLLSLADHANKQAFLLIDLIEEFRIDCTTSSSQVLQQRESISLAFDRLLSHLCSILLQFVDVKNEARHITLELILQHQQTSSEDAITNFV